MRENLQSRRSMRIHYGIQDRRREISRIFPCWESNRGRGAQIRSGSSWWLVYDEHVLPKGWLPPCCIHQTRPAISLKPDASHWQLSVSPIRVVYLTRDYGKIRTKPEMWDPCPLQHCPRKPTILSSQTPLPVECYNKDKWWWVNQQKNTACVAITF